MKTDPVLSSSFRDPSGFLFVRNSSIYRQINRRYQQDYDTLMASGLYSALVDAGLLVPHEEVDLQLAPADNAYKVIQPERIPFISYPYEWCFSQLKDAALATLAIQKRAFDFGMTLKDSSAYNIQFWNGKPVLIDTLSFEKYQPGSAWTPYRQFCQHFLGPLALMAYRDVRLSQIFRIYIDGMPLDLVSRLLPFRTHLRFSLLVHIHLHAGSQKHFADKAVRVKKHTMSRTAMVGLLDSLQTTVKRLRWRPRGTEWGDYYTHTNYSEDAFEEKRRLVGDFLDSITTPPKSVWDLGANRGQFSRVASEKGFPVRSFDIDPAAVEKNYLQCVQESESSILPLLLDLTNPSPAIGWDNTERMSLLERGPADAVLALALIHHLAISNNLPLEKIAAFFERLCRWLIIEFVPKSDSQVQRLLATREDIFPRYTQQAFEESFGSYFAIRKAVPVKGSERTLYLMENYAEPECRS